MPRAATSRPARAELNWKEKRALAAKDEEALANAAAGSGGEIDVPIGVVINPKEYPEIAEYVFKDAISDIDEIRAKIEEMSAKTAEVTEEQKAEALARSERRRWAKKMMTKKVVQADLLFGPQPQQDSVMPSKMDTVPAHRFGRKQPRHAR